MELRRYAVFRAPFSHSDDTGDDPGIVSSFYGREADTGRPGAFSFEW